MTGPGGLPRAPGAILVDLAERIGGTETRVMQLAEHLPRQDVPATVICLRDRPLHRALHTAGLDHVALKAHSKRDPRLILQLRRLLRARPGWIVDTHNSQSHLAALLAEPTRARRSPVLATVHSEYRRTENGAAGLREHTLKAAGRAGWTLVAISDSVQRYLTRIVPDATVPVIWSAAPEATPSRPRADVRDELGLAADDRLLVAAGRLNPPKNYPLMLRAVADLVTTHPQARLAIAGDGPLAALITAHADELGLLAGDRPAVRLLGHREDVPDLLAAADVCVMTSSIEGLPYTLLEAAGLSIPIVSTSVGSIGTIFRHGETAVLLTDATPSPRDVADALRGVLDDPGTARRLATAAYRQVIGTMTTSRLTEQTISTYRQAHPSAPWATIQGVTA